MYGLIFDCDGVLADTEAAVCKATIDMFRDMYGVEMVEADFTPYIGTGPIRYTEAPAAAYGLAIDLDAAIAKREENFVAILDGGDDISFPGIHALIDSALAHEGWKLGIATSSSRSKSRKSLGAAGVPFKKFDAYKTGDDVVAKKPAPDIYLRAAEELGIAPEHCVGIEDSINGVEAVKAAGMVCVAVTNSFEASKLGRADLVVDSLESLSLSDLQAMIAS